MANSPNISLPSLVIDTATPTTTVMVVTAAAAPVVMASQGVARADNLLELIDQALAQSPVRLADLGAIIVRRGLGSYTGLRIGVSVANLLAWSLDIPVIGLLSAQAEPLPASAILQTVRRRPAAGPARRFFRPVVPKYAPWPAATVSGRLKQP